MGYGGGPAARNLLAESGIKLRLSDLAKGRPLRPHMRLSGRLTWTSYGRLLADVSFELTTSETAGSVRLIYTATPRGGVPVSKDYLIGLVTTEQPGGGVRFWFWCDYARAMCSTLRMMPGSVVFVSRQAFTRPLSYRSQWVSERDRNLEKAQAIRQSLGGAANLMEPFPEKPPRMWFSTYARKRQKAEAAAGVSLAFMGRHLDRVMPGWRDQVRTKR